MVWSNPLAGEGQDLHAELQKKANDALLVTLANDLDRRLRSESKASQLEDMRRCLRGSSNSSQYALCILSTMEDLGEIPKCL